MPDEKDKLPEAGVEATPDATPDAEAGLAQEAPAEPHSPDAPPCPAPEDALDPAGSLRHLRRRVLLFFLAVLSFVAVSIALINSRIGGDVLLTLLNAALDESGGGELSAEIRVDLLSGAVRAERVSLDLGERGLLTIQSFSVALQPFQLLRNRIIINEIRVVQPRVFLDMRKPGQMRGEPLDLTQLLDLPVDLVVHRVQVSAAELSLHFGGDGPAELRGIALRSHFHEGIYRLGLETGAGRLALPGVDAPINLITAEAELKDGDLTLRAFNIFLQGMRFSASGHTTQFGEGENILALDLAFPLSRLSDIIQKIPVMEGEAHLRARLGGKVADFQALGTLALRDARIGKQRLENADLAFSLDREGLRLDGSVFHIAEGSISLDRAEILFKEGIPVSAALSLDRVELAHILKNLAGLDSHTSQYQSGTVTAAGTLNPVRVDGFVDLSVRDHRTHTVGMSKRRGAATEIVHVPLGQVKSPISVTDRYFQFHDGKVYVGQTVIDIVMTRLGFDRVFHFEYKSDRFDFLDARAVLGIPTSGKGELGVAIHVDRGNTSIKGHLDIRDFVMGGYALGHMNSQIVFRHPELSFQEAVFRKGNSTYHARVSFNFNHSPVYLGVDLATDSMYLDDLFAIVGLSRTLDPLLQGRLVGNGTFYGPMGNFSGGGRFVLPELNSPHQTLRSGLVQGRLENNLLTFERVEVRGASSRVRMSGTLDNWTELDLHLKAEDWPIAEIDLARDLFGETITGNASLNGRIRGSLSDPLTRLSLFWENTRLGESAYDPSELHLEWSREHLDIKGNLFGKRARFTVVHQFPPLGLTDLDVTLQNFPYPLAVLRYLDVSLDGGRISGEVRARIPHSQPEDAKGEAAISAFSLRAGDLAIRNDAEMRLRLAKGVFRLDPARLLGRGVAVDLRGDVDLNGNLDIALLGRLDWRLVALLVDGFQEAQGMLDADLHLGGRWGRPALTGKASFQNSRLRVSGTDTLLDNLRGTLLLDVDRVEVQDVTFSYGGGQISMSGHAGLDLPGFNLGDTRLQVELIRVGMELQNGFVPVLSGRLTVSGKPWPLLVEGRLRVDEAIYSRHIRWQKHLIVDRIMGLIRPTRARDMAEETPRLTFNVKLDAPETLEIRNNLARLELTADLLLTGTDLKPGLLDTVSANRGSFFFLQNEFDVRRFMIEFERSDEIYPRFDIYGETLVTYFEDDTRRDVRIYLSLLGTLDEMEITMTSDAGLNQTDIVSLLVTGQPASSLEGTAGMATGLNALSALYGVDDEIRHRFRLDEFRLTSGYASSDAAGGGMQLVPKLVIGKEIAENIFITYTTTLGDTEDRQQRRFDIRYRFDPFVLSLEWDNDSTLQHGNFGTDLMFHIDF